MIRSSLAQSEFGCSPAASGEAANAVAEGERFLLTAKQTTIAAKTNNNVGIRIVVNRKTGMVIRKESANRGGIVLMCTRV